MRDFYFSTFHGELDFTPPPEVSHDGKSVNSCFFYFVFIARLPDTKIYVERTNPTGRKLNRPVHTVNDRTRGREYVKNIPHRCFGEKKNKNKYQKRTTDAKSRRDLRRLVRLGATSPSVFRPLLPPRPIDRAAAQ